MEFKLINLDHLPLRWQETHTTMQLRGRTAKRKNGSDIKECQGYIINHRPDRKFAKLVVCLTDASGTSQSQIKLFWFRMPY